MELTHNKENVEFNAEKSVEYPVFPQNHIIYMLFGGLVFTPESIWPLNTFLEKREFNGDDAHNFENIRFNLKETYKKAWFMRNDENIVIEIIDKLYDYFTKYKNILLNNIDKLKNSTERIDEEYRLAYRKATQLYEEYLIEMLQLKYMGLWAEDDKFYLDKYRLKLEWLILDYFWDFERQSQYLKDLEQEYEDNLIKIDELLKSINTLKADWNDNFDANLNALNEEVENLKYQNIIIKKTKIVLAKQSLNSFKNEIYRLSEWSWIILSQELCSKLWNYPEFSELLIENDKKISAIEAETLEVE